MLTIDLKETEYYEQETNTFYTIPAYTLKLEHSLYSLSEWESRTKKSLIDTLERGMSIEDTLEYVKCMDLNKPPTELVYYTLTKKDVYEIQKYIDDPRTATTINTFNKSNNFKKQKITSELIYYWMIEAEIPFECEHWNLNRLFTLIRVISAKRDTSKMSKKDLRNYNKAEMARRRRSKSGR